jgi:glucose/arabinose dehydrogenase
MRIPEFLVKQVACGLALLLTLSVGATGATAQQTTAPSTPAAPAAQEAQPGNTQSSGAQNDAQPQSDRTKPVGTAVGPYEKTNGITASKPAGAVIAPAKQRRVRAILIKVGVIVGAGVAIGTVAALSHGSPSQPH